MAPKSAVTRLDHYHSQDGASDVHLSAVPLSVYREAISVLTAIELLLMRSHESGSTSEQLAVLLDLDPREVEKTLHRARARLRTNLQTLLPLEEGMGDVGT